MTDVYMIGADNRGCWQPRVLALSSHFVYKHLKKL